MKKAEKKKRVTRNRPGARKPVEKVQTTVIDERKNDAICIIGMHRSGTSMIARLLNLCGLDLGPSEQFLEPNEYNPLGYFENETISKTIDDALLAHFGGSWDNPPLFEEDWEYDPSLEQIVHQARSLLKTFSERSPWGWKDPRTTILLPFWKSLIPNLRFVICVRSPLDVAKSLARRNRMPIQKGVYLWNQYMRAAIRDTEGCPRIFTFYEDFFREDMSDEIDRLVEFCGLQLPDDNSILHDAISSELKHHTSETYELLDEDKVTTTDKLFYIGLRALTTEGFLGLTSDSRREELISENISNFFRLLERFHDEQPMAQLQSALSDKEQQITGLRARVHHQQQVLGEKEQQVTQFLAQQGAVNQERESLQVALQEILWKTYPGRLERKAGAKNILVVAHLAEDYLFGGERSLLDILGALRSSAHNVFVAVPRDTPQYINALRAASVEVAVLKYEWGKALNIDKTAVSDFMAYMAQREIDLVHVNTIVIPDPLVAARRLAIPSIVHVREIITGDTDLVEEIGLPGKKIVELVLQSADYVIGNSEKTATVFNKPGATFVLPNCVDVEALDLPNDVDSNEIRIGLICNILPKKGIEDFAQLAKDCYELIPNLKFLLIGPETEHAKALRRRQLQGDLPSNLQFVGYQEQPRAAIEKVNIVANLSRFQESFGRTVIEGMAARRPAIVYDNGNPPELVDHGETGFVIPYPDCKAAIPHLQQLCESPDLIKQMGAKCRRFAAENFSSESFTEKIQSVYSEVLANPAREQTRDAQPGRVAKFQVLPARITHQPAEAVNGSLRIAYFCWHFPVPSETFVLNELRDLVQRGYVIRVFCRQSPYPDFRPDFPIEWEHVEGPETLARRLQETNRDFIHAHFTYPTVTEMVWPACEQAGIQFTFIAHAQDIFKYENDRKNRIAEIVASEACRRVLVLGRFHHDYLVERGVPAEKIVINSHGLDLDLFEDPTPVDRRYRRTRKVCAVHRLVRKKGLDDLVQAGKLLEPDGVEIDIYGYGPDEDHLREFIANEQVSNVTFCGPVCGRAELIEVLRNYDLFACPSVRTEDGDMDGIPTVLMEAMALGLPVLTTPIASIPDLVKDGVTGLMCKPCDPESIVGAIRSFYDLPPAQVQAMIENARSIVKRQYDIVRKTRRLRRLWRNERVDLVIVSRNNLPQLREVIRRIYQYTTMPFHLIICDNHSDAKVVRFLGDLWQREDNVTLIHNGYNSFVGPGANTALQYGAAKYAIYVCGKEGFLLNYGWEQDMIDYMEEHEDVGLAGTLGYSPTYLRGRDYIDNLTAFPKFRNQEFARKNPERVFRHVQGGLFVLRRKMFEEIGGFSEDVPHGYTDVEYSYYVESCGWKLGAIDTILALYNKTRPDITSRIDERVRAIHPPSLEDLPLLDRIAAERTSFCNLCGWDGEAFDGPLSRETCPQCGSGPPQRTLYRYLAESTLTHRRLTALYVNPHPSIEEVWRVSFQGRLLSRDEVLGEIEVGGQIQNATAGMDVVLLDDALGYGPSDQVLLQEVARILGPDGILLVRNLYDMGEALGNGRGTLKFEDLAALLQRGGFEIESETLYASVVVRYDWLKLLIARKLKAPGA